MVTLKRKLRKISSNVFIYNLTIFIRSKLRHHKIFIATLSLAACILIAVWFSLRGTNQRHKTVTKSLSHIQKIVEHHITQPDNEMVCEMFDPPRRYTPFRSHVSWPRDCGHELNQDWVKCYRSKCYIDPRMAARKERIVCDFTDLFWKNDFDIRLGRKYRTSKFYVLEKSNYVQINCTSVNGETWIGVGTGTRTKIDRRTDEYHNPFAEPSSARQFNVVVLILESLSRNAFTESLPLSYSYLSKELGGHILKMYNIIGDERLKNILPILTGATEFELNDARRGVVRARPFDPSASILELGKRRGYITGLNENVAAGGVFTTRHQGFARQPADYYLRTLFLASQKLGVAIDENCVGNRDRFKLLLDHTSDIFWKHPDQPKLVVNIHSHGSYASTKSMDANLLDWLKEMGRNKVWNDTILIIMSDRGADAGGTDRTLEQKIQQRMPFVSFVLPEAYRLLHPYHYAKFLENIHRLSTPFDLHSTILPVVAGMFAADEKSRTFSLFSEMPRMRSCASAYIEPQWCACRSWEHIEGNLAEAAASLLVETINKATTTHRQSCVEVRLSAILGTLILKYQPNLLKFQGNKDVDGYEPDLTGTTKVPVEFVRAKIAVQPGLAIFDGIVTFDRARNKCYSELSDIVRVVRPAKKNIRRCLKGVDLNLADFCVCSMNKP